MLVYSYYATNVCIHCFQYQIFVLLWKILLTFNSMWHEGAYKVRVMVNQLE